jgi:hypothetical protein
VASRPLKGKGTHITKDHRALVRANPLGGCTVLALYSLSVRKLRIRKTHCNQWRPPLAVTYQGR